MDKHVKKAYGATFFPAKDYPLAVVPMPETEAGETVLQPEFGTPNLTYHPHCHDFSELVMIFSGSGTQNISGEDYPVVAGDVFLLQGHTVHYFKQSNDLRLTNILFDSDKLPLPHGYLQKMHGYNALFRAEPQMRSPRNFKNRLHLDMEHLSYAESLVRKIKQELERQDDGFEAVTTAMLLELISFVSRNYGYDLRERHSIIPQISLALTKLENNFRADWNVTKLAKMANTSERHFARLFRQATGNSPIDYLLKLRLRHAAKLLEQDTSNISEIAALCGFKDSNYFSKKFSEAYQMSPSQHRKIM
jgi:AraC-like DNA-binding protein/mannose-6-phosphate isomerase-like protein (cupin superfamily)